MTTSYFKLTMLSDVVVSERSSTTGGHSCLTYVPGVCFLGACAGKLYAKLRDESVDKAYTVFHSGEVRFGNAYPVDIFGQPAYPVPLSWHVPKGEKPAGDKTGVMSDKISNRLAVPSPLQDDIQYKQVRDGYFSYAGGLASPGKSYALKTAINSDTGRPADAQLFGYESLDANSEWHFSIDFGGGVDKETINLIADTLTEKSLRIGRSRSAEYGHVRIERAKDGFIRPESVLAECEHLSVYCLSDIALADRESGAPTLVPDGRHFGLEQASLVPEKSYIRTRSYSPFNGTWKASDLERQVICKGSVITFRNADGRLFTTDEVTRVVKLIDGGVGMYRHDGLGRVVVNPAFLAEEKFKPEAVGAEMSATAVTTPESRFDPGLIAWIENKDKKRSQATATLAEVTRLLSDLKAGKGMPNSSQWSQLRRIALESSDKVDIMKKLFDENIGLCAHGVSKKQWNKEFKRSVTYADFLKKVVCDWTKDDAQLRDLLYVLGEKAPRWIKQGKEGA